MRWKIFEIDSNTASGKVTKFQCKGLIICFKTFSRGRLESASSTNRGKDSNCIMTYNTTGLKLIFVSWQAKLQGFSNVNWTNIYKWWTIYSLL